MASYVWTANGNDNNLNNATNWNPTTVPGTADTATFQTGKNSPVQGTLNVAQLVVTAISSAPISVALVTGSTITAGTEIIADAAFTASLDLGSATNNVTNGLTVGNSNGATGEYHIGAGTLTVGTQTIVATEVIGNLGAGQFDLEGGGSNSISGVLTLGAQAGSSGTYNIKAGTLSVKGDEVVGSAGSGQVGQQGGSVTLGGSLLLGVTTGTGIYDMNVGSLGVAGNEVIGVSAIGSFDQSGGTNSVTGGVTLALNSGSQGKYLLHGGTLSAGSLTIGNGGGGLFDINSGADATINGITNLGVQIAGDGDLEVRDKGSTFTASGVGTLSTVNVGVSGSGTLDIENGGLVAANYVNFGSNTTGKALGDITGSNSQLSVANNLVIGQLGQGAVTAESNGAITAGHILLGNGAGSKGALKIDGAGTVVHSTSIDPKIAGVAVGVGGTGGIVVENQGTLDSDSGIALGVNSKATGGLIVIGNSQVTASTSIQVGISGTGGLAGGEDSTVSAASISVGKLGGIEAGSHGLQDPSFKDQFTGTLTLNTANLTNGGIVSIDDGSTLQFGKAVSASTFTNNASVKINAAGDQTKLMLSGNVTLAGTGTVTLTDDAHNRIASDGKTASLTNAGNTIVGAGTIGDSHLVLVNKGIINGNSASNVLALHTGGNTITNQGTLEGSGAQGLRIESNADNSGLIEALGTNARVAVDSVAITNTSTGVILASGAGAHVDLDDITITGGTLRTTGIGAAINLTGANAFDGSGVGLLLNSAAVLNLGDGSSLQLKGTLNNTGTMTIGSTGDETDLIISGSVTLAGTGHVTLTDHVENIIGSNGLAATLINVGNIISGAGTIDDDNLTLDNQAKGIINAVGTHSLTIDVGTFTNEGKLEATGTGGLVIADTTVTASPKGLLTTLALGSHIDLDGATITGGLVTVVAGSKIDTLNDDASTITASKITNAGTIAADHGNLTINGAVTNTGGLVADNSVLDFTGAVTGLGSATIANDGILEFGAASSAKVTFLDTTGTLQLDAATTTVSKFTGTISGFHGNNVVELGAISYTTGNAQLLSYVENKTNDGGVLTVTDGTHTETLAFMGNYTLADFTTQQDAVHHVLDLLHV